MSIGPELVGKKFPTKFPTKSGVRPMTRERFASRVLTGVDRKEGSPRWCPQSLVGGPDRLRLG
jgi:hypothetical protein